MQFVFQLLCHLPTISMQFSSEKICTLKSQFWWDTEESKSRLLSHSVSLLRDPCFTFIQFGAHRLLHFESFLYKVPKTKAEAGNSTLSYAMVSTGWPICIGTTLGGRCEVMDWFRKKKFYQKKFLRYIAFIVYKKDFL